MTTGRVALMSLSYGVIFGVPLGVMLAIVRGWRVATVAEDIGIMMGVFFVLYRMISAVAWNARAIRLRRGQGEVTPRN